MEKYIAVICLVFVLSMVLIKSFLLNKFQGIKAIVFGKTDKRDFFIIPFALLFFYQVFANAFGWRKPFESTITRFLFDIGITGGIGAMLCLLGVTIIFFSLISFGKSFRVGVDIERPDKLITTGMFAISRNPIYVAFATVLLGLFLIIPTYLSLFFLIGGICLFHRQVLIEEAFLKTHYGKEYEAYCQRVKRYL